MSAVSSYGWSIPPDYVHSRLKTNWAFIVGNRMNLSNRCGQLAAMPTIGELSLPPPIEPKKPASPKAKIPPSLATSQ